MKAKKENIVCKERHALQAVLPLDTPYTIAIDPCNLCNFKCEFCAMQTTKEPQIYVKQMMGYDLFKKIVDDIAEFPEKLKVLRLNGQGEPMLNKEFCRMVRYAKEREVADWIETITNGSCLNPTLNQELVESGINRIRISIEAIDEQGYLQMANTKIKFEEFLDNIQDLYERSRNKVEIYIKIVDAAVPTEEKKNKFYEIFGDMCDRIFIDQVIPLWSDFESLNSRFDIDKSKGIHGQKIQDIIVCPFPFYSFIINPDGAITVCCADWKQKFIVGNVNKDKLINVWNGKKYNQFLVDLLYGRKNNYEMCSKCLLPIYDCNDNIDEYASDLVGKYEVKRDE